MDPNVGFTLIRKSMLIAVGACIFTMPIETTSLQPMTMTSMNMFAQPLRNSRPSRQRAQDGVQENPECDWNSSCDSSIQSWVRRWTTPKKYVSIFTPRLIQAQGFFTTYRSLFDLLASDEEANATADSLRWTYPSFGDSQSPYASDTGSSQPGQASQCWIKDFYTVWSEFSTEKSFEWVRRWDTERADDRSMRRMMEKENKKTRDEYRKDYNDAVRVSRFISDCR